MNAKGIVKKIALALAGVCALGAVGFGIAKLVEFVKDDLKTITPSFDVGNLGTDGKYVNDESTLYTKEAFECDGLQIKLDFDNEINYQIYFYDDLDNFIESTEVLSAAYSETVHDGYARIVIMPTDDEDEKISLTERVTYPGQMTIKVAKEQNVEYINVFNKRLRIVDNIYNARFNYGFIGKDENGSFVFQDATDYALTTYDFIKVDGGSTLSYDYSSTVSEYRLKVLVLEFSFDNGKLSMLESDYFDSGSTLNENTDFILIRVNLVDSESQLVETPFTDTDLQNMSSIFTITK